MWVILVFDFLEIILSDAVILTCWLEMVLHDVALLTCWLEIVLSDCGFQSMVKTNHQSPLIDQDYNCAWHGITPEVAELFDCFIILYCFGQLMRLLYGLHVKQVYHYMLVVVKGKHWLFLFPLPSSPSPPFTRAIHFIFSYVIEILVSIGSCYSIQCDWILN